MRKNFTKVFFRGILIYSLGWAVRLRGQHQSTTCWELLESVNSQGMSTRCLLLWRCYVASFALGKHLEVDEYGDY